ncbi:VanW family protein [Candidatus Parcubacteria bacterium]|nr:VanW family protein [Candidatus Parcubacteria bacterium]
MSRIKIKINIPRWLLDAAIVFFIACLITASLYFIFEKKYQNKIYPGVWIGEINLGGKTVEQAKSLINEEINNINRSGITFYYEKNKVPIMPTIISTESDFAYQIINFDSEKSVDQAYNLGRDKAFFSNLKNKINGLICKRIINLSFSMNETEIQNILKENFSTFEIPAEDAKLVLNEQNNNFTPLNKSFDEINGNESAVVGDLKPPTNDTYLTGFMVSEEKLGKIMDYKKAIKLLGINLLKLNSSPIQLSTETDYPEIYKKDCLNIEAKAKNILSLAPITLIFEDNKWEVDKEQLAQWLSLKIKSEAKNQDLVNIGLNKNIVEQFLKEKIAPDIDQEPINAKFEIKDGRVAEFQASRDGIKLKIEDSFEKINYKLTNYSFDETKENKIELVVKDLKSSVNTNDVNSLGINEIIGIGESIFAGSPQNRRHNIKTGADSLNGILIKPDEEFSINSALGEIDAESGYLPELVIKGNKTIPEYGGGLCQIGTTIFRAALSSGLPITQRRSHSYRVSYYEPAGTDATIYSPWPDMRFINDTGSHILIQSRIEGDNLYFDFWGTKDGRVVEKTEPTIYNIVKPGPTKYIETLDLPVGKEKCTERAHNGADAYFDYKVTYAGGEVKEEKISSHYIPWQEVCLIGVEKLSEEDEATGDGEQTTEETEDENNEAEKETEE